MNTGITKRGELVVSEANNIMKNERASSIKKYMARLDFNETITNEWQTETHKNAQKQNLKRYANVHVRYGMVENELKEEFETRCERKMKETICIA